MSNKEAAN